MNETQWIFLAIVAFGVGYGIAYLTKNIGSMANRWGIFSIILIPVIATILLAGAGMITELKNIGLSLVFAVGFVFRMLKHQIFMDFSIFIFLSVLMVAIGYIVSNSQNFNFQKIALLGLILIPLFDQFGFNKPHLTTMVIAFVVGYLLLHARILEGLGGAISDAINAVRYKDAYDEIR